MKRDLNRLSNGVYDLLVIGGGIYGLFAAWDAALRGLSVALVEKGDFGNATSANSLRVIHGGLRYLQSGDIRRMRQSIVERTNMMRMAPHLVHPMPFLIPTYGHGLKGKSVLSLALKIHDWVGFDRNRLADSQKHLPGSWTISRRECIDMFPDLDRRGLTGAAIYYDSQMHSSEQLTLAVLRSAVSAGAESANYVEATGFLTRGNRVEGIKARDLLGGGQLEIRANVVLNVSGPWVDQVLAQLNGRPSNRRTVLSKAFNLLIDRKLTDRYAFGFYSRGGTGEGDATPGKPSRMFFVTPWQSGSLIGTEHLPYSGNADDFSVTEEEIGTFIADINEAYPSAALRREDVSAIYGGLLPADGFRQGVVQLSKHYRIRDHEKEDGLGGLVSVIGVKFTESRYVAEKAVDMVFRKLGKRPPESITSRTPVYGGNIESFESFLQEALRKEAGTLPPDILRHLVLHYGTAYTEVLDYMDKSTWPASAFDQRLQVFKAEVIHAIRDEMGMRIPDIAFRCSTLKLAGDERGEWLRNSAAMIADELGWSQARIDREFSGAGVARSLADAYTMTD